MTEPSSRAAALSPKRRALLAQRLRSAGGFTAAPTIPPRGEAGPVRLSYAQERLWFLDRWQSGRPAYNLLDVVFMQGRLDPASLAGALREVLFRHEVLRSVVLENEGVPFQVLAPLPDAPLPVIDLSALPAAVRRRAGEDLAVAEGNRGFDLARGPLLLARLVHLAAEEHLLVLVTHHMVADLWSFGVILRELTLLYRAGLGGAPAPLPKLTIQYADFAVWQREWLAGEVLERQLAYWRRQLSGAPVVLELPADRPRALVLGANGGVRRFTLPASVAAALRALGLAAGATPFMVLLAAFDILLYRYSGQRSLLLGSPVAGRTRPELEPLVGLFVNTLVLRADLAEGLAWSGLLAQVRETTLAAFAHQDLPFERLVEDLQPARDPSRLPLVQVLFALQNPPVERTELPGLRLTPLAFETGAAKMDLSLVLTDGGADLLGILEYSRDLFDPTTAERIVTQLQALLAAIAAVVAAPETPVGRLPLASAAERHQLVAEWNDTAVVGRELDLPVHRLFALQAARTPDAVAVSSDEEALSYAELDRRADRLARHLRGLGVRPDARVALLLERSLHRLLAIVAALKTGGCYLPLDPALPTERLAFLLRDGAAAAVLTQESLTATLPLTELPVLCLDRLGEKLGVETDDREPLPEVGPDFLAYVMYTSGSTGTPKGVAVPHRGVVRLVWETNFASFGPAEVFFQFSAYSFDVSTVEIWGALLHGARLVMPPPRILSLREAGELITRHGVTALWLTTAFFHQMIDENLAGFLGVRQLLAGGEAMSVPHTLRALAGLPGTRVINGYGPTEGTTFTTCYSIDRPEDVGASVSVGRPIANSEAYVVDPALVPLPLGIPGELLAGGAGLARCYLGRPELTAERFVPNPFGGPGERLYRTGDLVRFQADGRVEFLGRFDSQVKIRGYRVELGEIETVLGGHPEVGQVAVLAQKHPSGERRLNAYLSPRPGAALDAVRLREYLRARLPDYMVPSAFVLLATLPLGGSGKVDLRALQVLVPEAPPGSAGSPAGAEPTAPRTPVEATLAGIWVQLLGVERVGIEDSFFALGGHSLLATRLAARLYKTFGVDLPLRRIFESPTLAELAAEIEAARPVASAGGAALPEVRESLAATGDAAPPLSFAQQRLWFVDQLDPGNPAYNISLFVRLRGPLDVPALWAALGEIVRRHEALRSRFPLVRGVPVLEVVAAGPGGGPLVDGSALPPAFARAESARLELAEQGYRFRLDRGPLLRAVLVRRGAEEHSALLTLHHIAVDGWSLAILARELEALYSAAVARRPSPLPELAVQYRDYAAWQRRALQGSVAERQLAYWTGQLAALPPPLTLPFDRPRPGSPGFSGAEVPIALSAEITRSAHALARGSDATLFIVLLAAFKVLLAAASGQRDLLVGSPVAGRTRVELEPMIGMFMNTLVLRTRFEDDPPFREIVHRVQTTALAAYDHQDLPFEQVVDAVLPARETGRPPLYQVWFVLQNQEAPRLDLPGLRAEALPLAPTFTKFDLALNLSEGPDGLSGQLEYAADLFDPGTAEQLAGAFAPLLARALADPEERASALAAGLQEALQAAREARRRDFLRSSRSSLMNFRRRPLPALAETEEKR